jgi:hypothetical protein
VSSDFEAIYRKHCAERLSRTQPRITTFATATLWVVEQQSIHLTISPVDPADSNAPGSLLRRLKLLENAEAYETVELTNYPYIRELLNLVAGTGDLPEGYDPWLALFTAVYLALPSSITDRICEDLIWGLGGDRDAFNDVFHVDVCTDDNKLQYYRIKLRSETIADGIANGQYVLVAYGALRDYLQSNMLDSLETPSSDHHIFSFYDLSVRFLKPYEYASECDCNKPYKEAECNYGSIEGENGAMYSCHMYTMNFSNSNPRMLYHMLTSQMAPVVINEWPCERFGCEADAVAFAEILCAYIGSKKDVWSSELVNSASLALVKVASIAQYFKFANTLLSNLVGCGVELEFSATRLTTAAVRHSEESYLAWRSFVKRAEVCAKIPPTIDFYNTGDMIRLQCALLEYNMLKYATDAELREILLKNLDVMVTSLKDGVRFITISELIIEVFIRGRIGDIRRLHGLGLDIEYLREHLKAINNCSIDRGIIHALEFADELGWFTTSGHEYRDSCMRHLLLTPGSFDAVEWLSDRYPDMRISLWGAFIQYEYSAYCTTNNSLCRICTISRHERREHKRIIRWILLENRNVWKYPIEENLVIDTIRLRDYHLLHLLYTIGGVKPRKEHVRAALGTQVMRKPQHFPHLLEVSVLVNGSSECEKHVDHIMFLILHCIRDALRANGVQLKMHELLHKARKDIDGNALDWMMRRGFFTTKPKLAK